MVEEGGIGGEEEEEERENRPRGSEMFGLRTWACHLIQLGELQWRENLGKEQSQEDVH